MGRPMKRRDVSKGRNTSKRNKVSKRRNMSAAAPVTTATMVNRSYVMQPKINFKGGSVKWFDDSKLIRKSSIK